MTSKAPVIRLVFFLIIGSITSCQGQTTSQLTEEQQLRKEVDEWMKPYRREQAGDFEWWIDLVENHVDGVWQHPVYQHIDRFYQQHRKQYLRLRKADLARYQPAPELLPGYEHVSDFYVPYEDQSFPLEEVLQLTQGVGNFRTLSVADIRVITDILQEYALQYLSAEKGLTRQQVINQRMFGDLFFADFIGGDQWQMTAINRLYTLTFNWNIADNHISKPELWVYTGEKQPAGWLKGIFPKPQTPIQQQDSALNTFRWAVYDEADDNELTSNYMVTTVPDKLTAYYRKRRNDYIRLRNEELAKYPSPDVAYAAAFNHDASGVKEDLLSVLEKEGSLYKVPAIMAPYEMDGAYIIYNFRYLLMRHLKNYAEYDLTAWIVGNDIYTRKAGENIWELQFFYHDFWVSFHWNIATDEISNLTIKSKRKVTVERPVSVPHEKK